MAITAVSITKDFFVIDFVFLSFSNPKPSYCQLSVMQSTMRGSETSIGRSLKWISY